MITPAPGVAFTDASDGDVRGDPVARRRVSHALGIDEEWAVVDQVHGNAVATARGPGLAGRADALVTTEIDLPLAVFTADCLAVCLTGDRGVGVAHAGWRGMAAGVVEHLRDAMRALGAEPSAAFTGPAIGSCCFEVGPEVAAAFPGQLRRTGWGTESVDLVAAARVQLGGLATDGVEACTRHEEPYFSHRRDGTIRRMAALVWRVA